MTHGSLFTGIGGFDQGFEQAGIHSAWQVEIDPFARAVLQKHFPEVPKHEDIRTVGKHNLTRVDIISGGFPCQDVSHSGARRGLSAPRSGLFFEAKRVIEELQPQWFVLENVPGLLSSNQGQDFAIVVETLCQLGYGVAWRVLDSQFFGVPQKRRRVFIVGRLGQPCPPEVLFDCDESTSDSGESKEWSADALAGSVVAHSGNSGDGDTIPGRGNVAVESPEPGRVGESIRDVTASDGRHAGSGASSGSRFNGASVDAAGVRSIAGIPQGLDGCSGPEDAPKNEKRRYKAAGNAACVNVCGWIAQRIADASLSR